jgi:hypothetical protein
LLATAARPTGAFAIPIIEPFRIAKNGTIEPAHQYLIGVGIDADLARLIVSDHDEPEWRIAFIDGQWPARWPAGNPTQSPA